MANKSVENASNTTDNQTAKKQNEKVDTEFVSDTFRTTDKDLEEVKAGMKILGIDTLAQQHVPTITLSAMTSKTTKTTTGKDFFVLIFDFFVFVSFWLR